MKEILIYVLLDNISCVPNPCQNGGQCREAVNTVICVCPDGTSGERCTSRSKSAYNLRNSLSELKRPRG